VAVTWTKSLALGVPLLDAQHEELFRRCDLLLEACNGNRGPEEVGKVVVFLQSYVRHHFQDEERTQSDAGFPDAEAHRAEHETFALGVDDLAMRLERDGPTGAVVADTSLKLVEWLVRHVRRSDRKVAGFLRSGRVK
jgi:hemerythrin